MHDLSPQFGLQTDRSGYTLARLCRTFRFLGLLLLFAVSAPRATATGEHLPAAPVASIGPGASFAIADFDGDKRLDVASVDRQQVGSSYWIRLHLTVSGQQSIQLIAPPGGLAIEARDVNGDHAVDLILTTAWFKQPVAVLLNDGHGRFTSAEPSQFPGAFSDSNRDWDSSSHPASESIGIPPQPRLGIYSEGANLPDVRGPTEVAPATHTGFALDSLLIAHAGRAPPPAVSCLT